jgi:histidinol-phosphate phosphatase family protein
MRKAVFLDKDGTLIKDVPYSAGPPEFLSDVFPALTRAYYSGYDLVVVTNQSGLAKGLITREQLDRQQAAIMVEFARNRIPLHGFYVCPHRAEDQCECRKPKPGLLFKAAAQLNIDLGKSWMVGDKKTDQEAGISAGCSSILLGKLNMNDAAELICALA